MYGYGYRCMCIDIMYNTYLYLPCFQQVLLGHWRLLFEDGPWHFAGRWRHWGRRTWRHAIRRPETARQFGKSFVQVGRQRYSLRNSLKNMSWWKRVDSCNMWALLSWRLDHLWSGFGNGTGHMPCVWQFVNYFVLAVGRHQQKPVHGLRDGAYNRQLRNISLFYCRTLLINVWRM